MGTGGTVNNFPDTSGNVVALEVVKTNTAPVLADTTLTLSSAYANSTPTGAVGDLVSVMMFDGVI